MKLWLWAIAFAVAKPPSVTVEEAPPELPPTTPAEAPVAIPEGEAPLPPDLPDVRRDLGGGIVLNWTRLMLEVGAGARGFGVGNNSRAVEQEARRLVGPGMLAGARSVQVNAEQTFAELEDDPKLGEALRTRVERWTVGETRYFSSGRVELDGELSLQELLKPWTLSVAPRAPESGAPAYTGLVLDARGTDVTPAWAPKVLSEIGEVVYQTLVWDDYAVERAPLLYVAHPGHPAAARAGDNPLRIKVDSASGCDFVISPTEEATLRAALGNPRVFGEGTVVVVVDP